MNPKHRKNASCWPCSFEHSNAGGGGERVLWMAIKAMEQLPQPDLTCLLYSGDDVSGDFMLNRAKVSYLNAMYSQHPWAQLHCRCRNGLELILMPKKLG